MMYYVNWKLTIAQLELIAADVSVVDYSYGRKKDKKRGRKGEFNDTKARGKVPTRLTHTIEQIRA